SPVRVGLGRTVSGAQPRDGALGGGDGRVAQPPRQRYPAGRVDVDLEDHVPLGGPDHVPGAGHVPVGVVTDARELFDAGDGRLVGRLGAGVAGLRGAGVIE